MEQREKLLGLYGPEDSKYLRLVARRAAEIGIKTAWVAGPTPGCVAYVADTDAGWPMWDMIREEDVDCIQHTGPSCCAAVVLRYIYSLPHGWRVCIIGRGHAVQRMDRALRCSGYSVDQCSSTALDMAYRVARAGIIVNSADAVTEEVLGAVPASAIVIDISGSMEPLSDRVADYVPRAYVGGWNIAELLRRVRVRIEEERNDERGAVKIETAKSSWPAPQDRKDGPVPVLDGYRPAENKMGGDGGDG